MSKADRGFASMRPEKQRTIASKGGRAAHHKGTAHEWDVVSAREAGRKGGLMAHTRRQERAAAKARRQDIDRMLEEMFDG